MYIQYQFRRLISPPAKTSPVQVASKYRVTTRQHNATYGISNTYNILLSSSTSLLIQGERTSTRLIHTYTMSTTIYYIQRHNFEHHEDHIGRVQFESAHATLDGANAEAKELLHYILEEEDFDDRGEIMEEGIQKNGRFKGEVRLSQDHSEGCVDSCVVTVEETTLFGGIVQVEKLGESRKRQRTEDAVDGDEVGEEDSE